MKYILIFLTIALQLGCASDTRPVPLTRDITPLIHPGMTTNDVRTVLMNAEFLKIPPREWSQRPRYYVSNLDEWPVRHKSVYSKLPAEVAAKIVFLDDMTIPCGWLSFNEYLCFYDQDEKLVTIWANEIR
ncbi:MAG: hypothetical protein PHP93_06135 [Kiritimatiellales bacterium]|nr:hypothetical protein [Kiritimatiellales bacterium]